MLSKFAVFLLISSLLFSCTPSNISQETTPAAVATSTVQATVTVVPTQTPITTRTPTKAPQSDGCGEFTPIPSKEWNSYPEDYEPVGYLRVFALGDLVYGRIIVEMGRFINPNELKDNNGIVTFSASFDTSTSRFAPHWFVFVEEAPKDIRAKVNTDNIVGSMEIVDLENKELPYSIDPATVDRIIYDVKDYVFRNSVLDLACPCRTEVDGIPFYYSR